MICWTDRSRNLGSDIAVWTLDAVSDVETGGHRLALSCAITTLATFSTDSNASKARCQSLSNSDESCHNTSAGCHDRAEREWLPRQSECARLVHSQHYALRLAQFGAYCPAYTGVNHAQHQFGSVFAVKTYCNQETQALGLDRWHLVTT